MNSSHKRQLKQSPKNKTSPIKKSPQKQKHFSPTKTQEAILIGKNETLKSFEEESMEIKKELEKKYAGPYLETIKNQKKEIEILQQKILKLEEDAEKVANASLIYGGKQRNRRNSYRGGSTLDRNYSEASFRSTAVEFSDVPPQDDLDGVAVVNQSFPEFEVTDASDSESFDYASYTQAPKPDIHNLCVQYQITSEGEQYLNSHLDPVNVHNFAEENSLPSAFEADILRAITGNHYPLPVPKKNKVSRDIFPNRSILPTIEDESDVSKETIESVSTDMAKIDDDQDRILDSIFSNLRILGIDKLPLLKIETLIRKESRKTTTSVLTIPSEGNKRIDLENDSNEADGETSGSLEIPDPPDLIIEDPEIETIARELSICKRKNPNLQVSAIISNKILELVTQAEGQIDQQKLADSVGNMISKFMGFTEDLDHDHADDYEGQDD